jgi:uncharacterized protein
VCDWGQQSLENEHKCRGERIALTVWVLILPSEFAMISLHETPAGVTFTLKIHPRAKKNAITGVVGDALKLSLTAPPSGGRANQACIEFLSELLHVPRSCITIASGHTSRRKGIRLTGVSIEMIKTTLEKLVSAGN